MPTYIRARTTGGGERRFDVRYRRGGAGWPVEHAGTFHTVKEANVRREIVAGWLAAGKNPKLELATLLAPPDGVTFPELAERWLRTRVDLDESTRESYGSQQRRIGRYFDGVAAAIAPDDVNRWIAALLAEGLAPGTIRDYVIQLRQVLDMLDVNPARHRSVRLPKNVRKIPEPPDAEEFLAMLHAVTAKWRPCILLMEQTGMRVSEAIGMEPRDIDRTGCRVRVRPEVAKKDRGRWIPIPHWYADVVQPITGVSRGGVAEAMRDKSRLHPHLLRHRRATIWHHEGVVAAELAARLGHSRPSMSLDVYSSVRPLAECHPSDLLPVLLEER